jgi:pectate lyase
VFYGQKGSAADQAKGDGSIDIKSDSKYITVSYCHFWDSGKSSLCGMKSESGPNYISYDHNWFDHSDSRHPRIRTMTVHVWNNYFDGNSKYGVGAAMNSNAFVEGNYFRNCKFPMLTSLQGNDVYAGTNTYNEDHGTFSGEQGGVIKSFGNVITGSQSSYWAYGATNILCKGTTKTASSMGINTQIHFDAYEATSRNETVPSNVKALGGRTYDNFDTNSSLMYSYTPDAAADVPAKVVGYYGAGRLNHGDFKWTFSNSEDTNSEVIYGLRTAINNYTSTLVGIYGDANQQGGGEGGNDDPDDPNPGTEISNDVECNFQNYAPSNNAFTVVGNYSNSKGTATVNGTTYTVCLKIESGTSITFTTTSAMTLTLVFGSQDTNYTIKVNGTKKTGSNGILTVDLDAGEYTLTKADTGNLFYIGLKAL